MKILIAEDDLIARKVLRTFLEKSQYEVVPVEHGQAALDALLAPDGPNIAVLDWMMPKLSGPQVCTKLRAASPKIRPYVMLLSARTEKQDIAAGLDAGADDFLPKPFNPVELLARLRVAERTIHYQTEVQRHVEELELLAQRYNLLGEIIGKQGNGTAEAGESNPTGGDANNPVTESSPATTQEKPPVELTVAEIDTIVVRTLAELGLGEAKVNMPSVPTTPYRVAAYTAWAGMILVREETWIDFLLEADPVAVSAIVERALRRRAPSDREGPSVLAETLTIISSALKASLQAQGAVVLSPILSRALRTDSLNKPPPVPMEREPHSYTLKDFSLNLTVLRYSSPAKHKTPGQLHESDILAQPFRSPEIADVLLLNQGVVLNEKFIEKLSTLAQTELKGLQLPVFQPSRLALYFYADTRSGALAEN